MHGLDGFGVVDIDKWGAVQGMHGLTIAPISALRLHAAGGPRGGGRVGGYGALFGKSVDPVMVGGDALGPGRSPGCRCEHGVRHGKGRYSEFCDDASLPHCAD